MPIVVSCKCGKNLRVKDELAGKRVKCPECAQLTTVPAATLPAGPAKQPADEKITARKAAAPSLASPPSPPPFWVLASDLLALSDDALYLTTLDEEKMQEVQAGLKAGDPVEEVLEKPDTRIALNTVTKVEGNLYHTFFHVKHKETEAKEESETAIHCKDQDSRDEVIEVLRQRLGLGWKKKVVEYSRLRAALEPLLVIAFFSFVTWCFYMAGAHPEDDKSSGGKVIRTNIIGAIFVWVYNLLGPWGVVSLGGLCIGLGVFWLVARLMKPPIMFTLAPANTTKPETKAKRKRELQED
jgi:hypothetical protein